MCLVYAILTLAVIFIIFGLLTYSTFGSDLDEPFITEMLPASNLGVELIKVLFCLNLVFSYPITINPTNSILESYVFGGDPRREKGTRVWARRFSRFMVCLAATLAGMALARDMDKFLGLLGALVGSPLALTLPALVHLKLVAQTRLIKMFDYAIIGISLFTLTLSTYMSAQQWINSEKFQQTEIPIES